MLPLTDLNDSCTVLTEIQYGKLANGINDTPVLMAIKSHLRNEKNVVIAISTNDALARKCRRNWKTFK